MKLPCILCLLWIAGSARAQSIALPWSGHGHDPQHTGVSKAASQPFNRIKWQTPVDLAPQYSGEDLLIHYGVPLVTRQNTVIVPVKTGASDGFRVEARHGTDGSVIWTTDNTNCDYSLPAHYWTPMFGIALTPKNRLYYPGAGGTVWFRDTPDNATGTTGRMAFYGVGNYDADPATFNANVKINTPITSDRYGNIFFGFQVLGSTTPALQSGIARIAEDGTGTWVAASTAAADGGISKVVMNCAPALSNNHRTLYVAVSFGNFSSGYLVALDSRTLAPLTRVRLKDVYSPGTDALLPDDGTAAPMVGPDGDVYFGVFAGSSAFNYNHYRGWLLHFNGALSVTKTAGAFGWDDTASVIPAKCVPSYTGTSAYLLLTKYNNYAGVGGDGVNKIAVLDPNDSMPDPITGATVMKEIMTQTGPTPDEEYVSGGYPNAVREWCVNTVAVDPFTKCGIINSEDGNLYRWDFTTNTFTQSLAFPVAIGEAYTPTVIGVDGTVYAISNAILYAIGQ